MAAPQNASRREPIEFPLNAPVTIALKYGEPRRIQTQYGERAMYTTVDNRVVFLDPAIAGRITELGINVREPFTITRKQAVEKNGIPVWEIARIPGDQPDGTHVAPKTPEGTTIPLKPMQQAETATRNSLIDEANTLVDAYAVVLESALATYQGRIKPDEIRSILLSAYIQRRQLSIAA